MFLYLAALTKDLIDYMQFLLFVSTWNKLLVMLLLRH